MTALVLSILLLALATAAALGRTADSRDPSYGLGPVLSGRRGPAPGVDRT